MEKELINARLNKHNKETQKIMEAIHSNHDLCHSIYSLKQSKSKIKKDIKTQILVIIIALMMFIIGISSL